MTPPAPTGSSGPQHDQARLALGALVLGALEPAERAEVEAHVATCPACTAELAEFAVLPGLLGRLAPDQAAAVGPRPADPPEELLERILLGARTRPARRRRIAAWTAAAVAAAAGVIWLVGAEPLGTEREPAPVVVAGWDRTSDVRGRVTLLPTPNGTQVAVTLTGVRPGEECQLVAGTADGRWEVASTWQATYRGEATVTGSTGLQLADIRHLTVKTAAGQNLLELHLPQ